MVVGQVVGNLWSTKKLESLSGSRFLVINVLDQQNGDRQISRRLVARDVVGAGIGETVLVVEGSSARTVDDRGPIPVDAAVIGIIDSIDEA